ncbi:MAG: hypothetical protein FJW13_06360 [Actinobacteria bacterium]|nr:hypothetical protein [Actinomycetota bacterium]
MNPRTADSADPSSRVILDDASINGRKGPSYDWQAMLIPSDPVFEASLQTMLGGTPVAARTRKSRRRS